jgi:outer membrane lipoprotein-sorting protein
VKTRNPVASRSIGLSGRKARTGQPGIKPARVGRSVAALLACAAVSIALFAWRPPLHLRRSAHAAHHSAQTDSREALAVWRRSLTEGEETPMRAEMTMSWRRHGITYRAQAHIVQGRRGRFRMEYVQPPDACGRLVFSDGQTAWQYEPNRKLLARTAMPPMSQEKDRAAESLIEANYRIALESDHATAAGRPAYIIGLLPGQPGKSSQHRWIDRQTGKTLRIETRYTDGILARMVSYDQVTLPATVTEADFRPMASGGLRTVSAPSSLDTYPQSAVPEELARVHLRTDAALGFRLMGLTRSRVGGKLALQLLYGDGIETLSIFVQHSDAVTTVPPRWRRAELQGVTIYENSDGHLNAVSWTRGGWRYTALSHLTVPALEAAVGSQLP